MKFIFYSFFVLFFFLQACKVSQDQKQFDKPKLESDTIRIANDELEYEILIFDNGFSSWFNSFAKPRNYYSQSYLESRNRVWVLEWNRRTIQATKYNADMYALSIDYQQNIDYGYEVNYMLYYYLVYFQLTNNQRLGGFTPTL